jgi:hypothetical protein
MYFLTHIVKSSVTELVAMEQNKLSKALSDSYREYHATDRNILNRAVQVDYVI